MKRIAAFAKKEIIRNCREARMNGHIAKPVDPEVMYQVIVDALHQSKSVDLCG